MRVWKMLTYALLVITSLLLTIVILLVQRSTSEVKPILEVADEVPNIVHFIRFGGKSFTFMEAICMLAALKNQRPNKIYVHTDIVDYHGGKYWDIVVNNPLAKGVIELKYLRMRTSIMGVEMIPSYAFYHASDFERINILMEYGGIYLDNDCYIVKDLREFFTYDMTFGWDGVSDVSNQVLIAKKTSKFLRLWRESFFDYRPDQWFYNGGYLPGKLVKMVPQWVHVVPRFLAEYNRLVNRMLYYWDTGVWKQHYVLHLLVRHQYMLKKDQLKSAGVSYPVEFNETNILNYPINLRQMALDVYPYEREVLRNFSKIYPHIPQVEEDRVESSYKNELQNEYQLQRIKDTIQIINQSVAEEPI